MLKSDQEETEIKEAEIDDNDDCDGENVKEYVGGEIFDEIAFQSKLNNLYCEITSMFIFSLPFVQIAKRIDFNEVPISVTDSDDLFNQINTSEDNTGLILKQRMKDALLNLKDDSQIEEESKE